MGYLFVAALLLIQYRHIYVVCRKSNEIKYAAHNVITLKNRNYAERIILPLQYSSIRSVAFILLRYNIFRKCVLVDTCQVFRWHNMFLEGREVVEDEPRA